jgi:hypothetical protein
VIRAAAIALPLWLRRPAAEPCPLLFDDAPLAPFDGIAPGFWARIKGWTDDDRRLDRARHISGVGRRRDRPGGHARRLRHLARHLVPDATAAGGA